MQEKRKTFDEFWLRIIALVTMTLDHVGILLESNSADNSLGYYIAFALRVIGRLAFPLFALMLAEGMNKTHDRVKYLERLGGLWAGIFLVETVLYYGFDQQYAADAQPQAFTDLFCFALVIYFFERKDWRKLFALLPLGWILLSYAADTSEVYAVNNNMTSAWSAGIPVYTRCSYSLYGFLIFLGFYYAYRIADHLMEGGLKDGVDYPREIPQGYQKTKDYRSLVNLVGISFFLVINVVFWGIHYFQPDIDPYSMGVQSYSLIAIVFLYFYNGKRGYDSKGFRYFEYGYYPVHLAIIAFIFDLIFS